MIQSRYEFLEKDQAVLQGQEVPLRYMRLRLPFSVFATGAAQCHILPGLSQTILEVGEVTGAEVLTWIIERHLDHGQHLLAFLRQVPVYGYVIGDVV